MASSGVMGDPSVVTPLLREAGATFNPLDPTEVDDQVATLARLRRGSA